MLGMFGSIFYIFFLIQIIRIFVSKQLGTWSDAAYCGRGLISVCTVCLCQIKGRYMLIKLFYSFSWAVTSTGPWGFMVCVYVLSRRHPKAQPTVVLEKSGNETATLVYKACGLSTLGLYGSKKVVCTLPCLVPMLCNFISLLRYSYPNSIVLHEIKSFVLQCNGIFKTQRKSNVKEMHSWFIMILLDAVEPAYVKMKSLNINWCLNNMCGSRGVWGSGSGPPPPEKFQKYRVS